MRVVAHLASVHNRTDNRVFYKQCIGLAGSGYSVKLIVGDGKGDAIIQGVEVLDFIPFSYRSRLIRIFIVSPIIMVKALKLRADLYHIHDPELLLFYLIFSPFFALIGTQTTFPPQSSGLRLISANSFLTLSTSAPGLSILLIATTIGTFAALII